MLEVESDGQGLVEFKKLGELKRTYVVCELRLREAYKLVTVDAALMLQPLFDTKIDLCRQAVSSRINRRADNCRER